MTYQTKPDFIEHKIAAAINPDMIEDFDLDKAFDMMFEREMIAYSERYGFFWFDVPKRAFWDVLAQCDLTVKEA